MNSFRAHPNLKRSSNNPPHWSEVYDSLSRKDQKEPLEAEELYPLFLAAYLTGKDNESADILARAHHQYLEKNNLKQGIRCAFWIGIQLMLKGERAWGSGWFSRAHRLIDEFQYKGSEKGLLSIPAALASLSKGQPEKAFEIFKRASEIGKKYNDPDLKTLSLLGQGQALIQLGDITEGFLLLDESMIAVESDELSPLVVGIVYCAVIETCQLIFDIRRAQEWTVVLNQWCESQPDLVPFRGQCLIRRSQIRHIHGEWEAITSSAENLEKTLEQMDRYNIVRGFLSSVDLSAIWEWTDAAPGRFIASPFILKPESSELERLWAEYAAGRFSGMGEIGTQLNGLPPNDPSLEPYFKLAEEFDVPVLIHTLGIGPYMPHFRSAAGSPLLLEDVLVKHPKLRLFVENAGYPYRDEMIAMMYQYPQLYADVSTITWVIPRTAFYDYLQAFIRAGLGKRLMFGSDQMVWPKKIGAAVEAIEQAPFLTEEQKRDIFYNNALRFLRLEKPKDDPITHKTK